MKENIFEPLWTVGPTAQLLVFFAATMLEIVEIRRQRQEDRIAREADATNARNFINLQERLVIQMSSLLQNYRTTVLPPTTPGGAGGLFGDVGDTRSPGVGGGLGGTGNGTE
ncbi:hypothetical protein HOY82DRAFT_595554 [Tuber indicum]|nr:hypothetical protein HOY82DRAFT_595554 [Tuber indicum]